MKKDMLRGILTALRQEDCVLFIGSGISMWSGLPSWTGLLNELAGFMEECGEDNSLVKREITNGDLLQAASYGFDKLTKPQIRTFMLRACRYGEAEPHEIHRKILNLGVKCFITTNYDKLLEMGIGKWREKEPFIVVTNRQLSEMGGILQARAANFVYKPHGDIGDAESIVLTREQYRSLLQNGERHMALETLKTLLVSRPVVYMGFGLRDPDFLYLRDILSNIYQGNVRDHYAIMADAEEAESDYWKRNYGIHLIGYETQEMPDGSRSHAPLSELLELLNDELHGADKAFEFGKAFASDSLPIPDKMKTAGIEYALDKNAPTQTTAEMLLAIMRYTARLQQYTKAKTEFGIRIRRESDYGKEDGIDRFYWCFVEKLLEDCEENAILIGAPGAGKTYALRRAAAVMAGELNKQCLQEGKNSSCSIPFDSMIIPVYIDLKLYDGDLWGMIEKEFSKSLPLETIRKECRCRIFLDSFNEMPKEYWDNGRYRQNFAEVLAKFNHAATVIGSRTADGLETYGFPVYSLHEIDESAIRSELAKKGVTAKLNEALYAIVSKPFYFQYIINGKIDIKNVTQPKHFYIEFFRDLQKAFTARFGGKAEIKHVLSGVAYRALDIGIEAFPAEFLYEEMNAQDIFPERKEKEEAVNWLIYKRILTPYSDGKIAFVHQTITEYLAAEKLMSFYLKDKTIIRKKIRFYRWDQTVLFMLNLLPDDLAKPFMDELFEIDFGLVLTSVLYMEFQKEKIANRILDEIIRSREIRYRYEWKINKYLRDIQASDENEERLWKIVWLGGEKGSIALACLWKWKGNRIKKKCMKLLLTHTGDDFVCLETARILNQIVDEADLDALWKKMDLFQDMIGLGIVDYRKEYNFAETMGTVLENFDEGYIREILIGNARLSEVSSLRKHIFSKFLRAKGTALSFRMLMDLFMQGYRRASTEMYFMMSFAKKDFGLEFVEREHIDALIDCFDDRVWAFDTLREILMRRADLCGYVKEKAGSCFGIMKAAVLFCIEGENQEIVFQELESLLFMEEEELENQPFKLIHDMRLTWGGREELFVCLLRLRNAELALYLFGWLTSIYLEEFGKVKIEDADWWLEWMEELEEDEEGRWEEAPLPQIGEFLAKYTDIKSREGFLRRFNDESCRYRGILLRYIIPHMKICLNDLNESAVAYIFEDLKENAYWGVRGEHFFAWVVDERFVREKMIPLLNDGNEILKNNLINMIEVAGARHRKRYLL